MLAGRNNACLCVALRQEFWGDEMSINEAIWGVKQERTGT